MTCMRAYEGRDRRPAAQLRGHRGTSWGDRAAGAPKRPGSASRDGGDATPDTQGVACKTPRSNAHKPGKRRWERPTANGSDTTSNDNEGRGAHLARLP
jgi:hypothetical protein